MISVDEVRRIRDELTRHPGPALTLYLSVSPADPENARAAWRLRARNHLRKLGAPAAVAGRVTELLEGAEPAGRTLLVVADESGILARLDLQLDLAEAARLGEPYLTPLLRALDEHERYAVFLLDGRSVRLCVAFLGELEERTDWLAGLDPARWAAVQASLEDAERPARHAEETDRIDEALAGRRHRALRELAALVEQALPALGADRLILGGPGERPRELATALPKRLRGRLAGELAVRVGEPVAELLAKVREVEEAAERALDAERLERAENGGVRGLEATLTALQEGRVYELLAPWPLVRTVGRCSGCGWTAAEPGPCPACGNEATAVPLDAALPGLAERYGARLEFLGGGERDRLEELGGLAGLVRF